MEYITKWSKGLLGMPSRFIKKDDYKSKNIDIIKTI